MECGCWHFSAYKLRAACVPIGKVTYKVHICHFHIRKIMDIINNMRIMSTELDEY